MSDNVIIREVLLERLEPAIPSTWRVVSRQRTVDKVNKTTLVVRQARIEKDPAAPATTRRAFFDLVLAVPLSTGEAGEDRLDDDVVDLLAGIDEAPGVVWETATKGIWSDANPDPCYVVSLYIVYNKIARKEP